jgi:hypothetical protein
MRFEGRELPSHAEPVLPAELKEGAVYFSVNFADREMLIPTMEAFVYIGRDLELEDSGELYFQDIESYRKGIRYNLATEGDCAQFLLESEDNLHLLEYERALEILMRCSLRRRERVEGPVVHARESQPGERLQQESFDAMHPRSLRFEDAGLQSRFIAELRKAELAFEIREDGAVTFAATAWPSLNTVAHTIRDSCFPWYFFWWKDPESAHLFQRELKASGLPFQVEHHDDRMVFLLPRGSEDLHEIISGRVQMRVPGRQAIDSQT